MYGKKVRMSQKTTGIFQWRAPYLVQVDRRMVVRVVASLLLLEQWHILVDEARDLLVVLDFFRGCRRNHIIHL